MTTDAPPTPPVRPLTRSSSDRRLVGVAGGLAAYFSLDPMLVRIGFVVATLISGAGLLAYLALAVLVPADRVPAAPRAAGLAPA